MINIKVFENKQIPEVDWSREKAISYTQFSNWLECPHRWKIINADKLLPTPPSIHFIFGTAIHETIQQYLDIMFNHGEKAVDDFDMHEYFQNILVKLYKEEIDKHNEHFSTSGELTEFTNDGLYILDYFKEHRKEHFPSKGYKLLGIELPINVTPHPDFPRVKLIGKLDLVLYDEDLGTVIIIDIKTSTRGWTQHKKADKISTQYQLVLYKKYLCDFYGLDPKSVDIKYFIVKRKIDENAPYEAMRSRIQLYEPASGKTTMNKLERQLKEYIEDCFTPEATVIQKEYTQNAGYKTCRYCPLLDKPELCNAKNKKKK